MATQPNVGIGSTVWVFDPNRRVYREPGMYGGGGPIYREHWVPQKIIGETSRSWELQYGRKIPKRYTDPPPGVKYTAEDLERHCFVEDNRHKISQAVGRLRDYDVLKRIADWIGYKPE